MAEDASAVPDLKEVLNNRSTTWIDQIKNPENVSSDTIQKVYDKWVPSYDEEVRKHKYQGPSKASAILSHHCLEKNISILDCGAGTGLVGKELHALGYTNIVGIDLSPKSLAAAEQKGVYQKLICADVGKGGMPFDDKCFDALICCGCFTPTHLQPECLREWVRVVKSGGIIVLVMSKKYTEIVSGKEQYFSNDYQQEFNEVTQDLTRTKRWEATSKIYFPDYLENSPGLAFVWKVL